MQIAYWQFEKSILRLCSLLEWSDKDHSVDSQVLDKTFLPLQFYRVTVNILPAFHFDLCLFRSLSKQIWSLAESKVIVRPRDWMPRGS